MKTLKTLILLSLVVLLAACGPTIYKSAGFEDSKSSIKKLAILPFTVSIDSKKLPKGVTVENIMESQMKTGYDMQGVAYKWLLQREKNYTTQFQDVDKTNALLKKANITYDNLSTSEKGELATLLGVDGVISGRATLSKPMSEAGAIVVAVLIGGLGSTNKATTALTIHDTKSDLLWKYDYQASGSLGSNAESLTNALMRNASKKYPYKVSK